MLTSYICVRFICVPAYNIYFHSSLGFHCMTVTELVYFMYMILFNPHNVIVRQSEEPEAKLEICPWSDRK